MQHRIETQIQEDGKVILNNLPFHKGEKVIIIISQTQTEANFENKYPLQGVAIEYRNPFEPVSEDEWSAMQ